jgi:hypothetical protein
LISINVFPSILLTFSVSFDIYLFILYLKIQKIKNIFFLKNRNGSNLFSQIPLSLSLSLFNSSSDLKLSLFDNKVKLYLLKWQALVVHGERERESSLLCVGAHGKRALDPPTAVSLVSNYGRVCCGED